MVNPNIAVIIKGPKIDVRPVILAKSPCKSPCFFFDTRFDINPSKVGVSNSESAEKGIMRKIIHQTLVNPKHINAKEPNKIEISITLVAPKRATTGSLIIKP